MSNALTTMPLGRNNISKWASEIRRAYVCSAVASLPALGPWAPPAERGPLLESIYRVSLTVELCEG